VSPPSSWESPLWESVYLGRRLGPHLKGAAGQREPSKPSLKEKIYCWGRKGNDAVHEARRLVPSE
jgi:hypothetical protein